MKRTSWIWRHCWQIKYNDNASVYWQCLLCTNKSNPQEYKNTITNHMQEHLQLKHFMGVSGPLPKLGNISVHHSKTQPTLGSFINSSTLHLFILQWIICNHIPFRKIESPYLHQFLAYLNPSVDKLLPSHQT